jgi:hemolysin activation/secretion protein
LRDPSRSRATRAIAALILSALPALALAQAAPPPGTPTQPSREELNPAARIATAPAGPRDIFTAEPPGPCPLRDSTLTFTLRSVSFHGLTALTPAQLAPAYQGMIGKTLPVSAICDIRDRASRVVFNHGVLARVEIPEQTISGGALVLEVIEAHVVNVRVRGDAGHAQAAVERYIDKLRGMTPFDMRKAQRYLLLASDIPGVQVRAAVRPSVTGERGAVDLDITVTAKPIDVVANVQNLESDSVGRWGGLARIDFDSFTDLGEDTSLVGYHTLGNDEQWVAQLLEEARIGGDGLIARGSLVYGQTRPGAALAPLALLSDSLVGEAELAYPVIRLRRQNLNLAGGLDIIDESTDTGGLALDRDKLRVFYVRASGDTRLDSLDHIFQISGALTLRKGISGLGASPDDPTALIPTTRPDGKSDAWVVRGSGQVVTNLADRLQFIGQVQGQYSPDALLEYEQFSLGNLTVGRGYDPGAVLGDSGVGGELQLRYGPWQVQRMVQVSPYVFYDAGHIHDNGVAALKDRTLTSAGLGVLFRLANRANLDLSYAKPFQSPFPGQPKPPSRILLNLTAGIL